MNQRRIASAIGLLLALSVLLVEVVLRVYTGSASGGLADALGVDPYSVLVEPHGVVGYRPRGERIFRYDNGTAARTNAIGFRGPIVSRPKPAGTFRIVLLGGSSTFGWGVNDDETIGWYMRRMLAERYPNRVIEVVSLAFDGYDSYQLYERLLSDGLTLEPDAVIVNTGVNDVRNARFLDLKEGDPRTLLYRATMDQLRREQARGGPTMWTRAKHHLYLARLPGWLRQRGSVVAAHPDGVGRLRPPVYSGAMDYFERNLRRLVELATRSESTAVLLSTPPSSLRTRYHATDSSARSYWLQDAQATQAYRDSLSARLQTVATEEGARRRAVVYVPHGELPPTLFLDDAHLTSEGNRRVAEDFVQALEPWLGPR